MKLCLILYLKIAFSEGSRGYRIRNNQAHLIGGIALVSSELLEANIAILVRCVLWFGQIIFYEIRSVGSEPSKARTIFTASEL